MSASPLIAVTGATGGMGGRVAARLAEHGVPQRLIVRDASRAPQHAGAEVRVTGGYGDGAGMREALTGVDILFFVPGEESPDRVDQHRAVVDAAAAAGVRNVVYLSFVGATADSTFTLGRDHAATERIIGESGLASTLLRMNLYLDFLPMMAGADGVIRGPPAMGTSPRSPATTSPTWPSRCSPPRATRARSTTSPAVRPSRSPRRPRSWPATPAGPCVSMTRRSRRPRPPRASYGAPAWQVEAWISTYTAIAAGDLAEVTDTVRRLAGHEPVTLDRYLEANPEALDHITSSPA